MSIMKTTLSIKMKEQMGKRAQILKDRIQEKKNSAATAQASRGVSRMQGGRASEFSSNAKSRTKQDPDIRSRDTQRRGSRSRNRNTDWSSSGVADSRRYNPVHRSRSRSRSRTRGMARTQGRRGLPRASSHNSRLQMERRDDRRGRRPPGHWHDLGRIGSRGPPPGRNDDYLRYPPRKPVLSQEYLAERKRREASATKFDVGPQGQTNMPRVSIASAGGIIGAGMQLPVSVAHGSVLPLGMPGAILPPSNMIGIQGTSHQQTRHARRIYVGGISSVHGSDKDVASFFDKTLRSCLAEEDTPSENLSLVGRVYLHTERGFAFLEFPSIQMATACMKLDRLIWKGATLKIKRPNDYQPHTLPPAALNIPDLKVDISKLEFAGQPAPQAEHRIYVGGLPRETTLAEIKPLFEQYGEIAKLDLVGDTMNPALCRGYCFVDYADASTAPKAIEELNGKPFGKMHSILKVQLASVGARNSQKSLVQTSVLPLQNLIVPKQPVFNAEDAIAAALAMTHAPAPQANLTNHVPPLLPPAQSHQAIGNFMGIAGDEAKVQMPMQSKVIVLMNMVPLEELTENDSYSNLVEEISEECRKFGNLLACVVPRSGGGMGKVYLHYEHESMASTAFRLLKGRRFANAIVDVQYYDQGKFDSGEYE